MKCISHQLEAERAKRIRVIAGTAEMFGNYERAESLRRQARFIETRIAKETEIEQAARKRERIKAASESLDAMFAAKESA